QLQQPEADEPGEAGGGEDRDPADQQAACDVCGDVGPVEVEEDNERDQRVEGEHQEAPRPAHGPRGPAALGQHSGRGGDGDGDDGEENSQGLRILADEAIRGAPPIGQAPAHGHPRATLLGGEGCMEASVIRNSLAVLGCAFAALLAIPSMAKAGVDAQCPQISDKPGSIAHVDYQGVEHLTYCYGPVNVTPGQNIIQFQPAIDGNGTKLWPQ